MRFLDKWINTVRHDEASERSLEEAWAFGKAEDFVDGQSSKYSEPYILNYTCP
jgi:hypothetical protein